MLRKNFLAKLKSIYSILCCLHNMNTKDLRSYVRSLKILHIGVLCRNTTSIIKKKQKLRTLCLFMLSKTCARDLFILPYYILLILDSSTTSILIGTTNVATRPVFRPPNLQGCTPSVKCHDASVFYLLVCRLLSQTSEHHNFWEDLLDIHLENPQSRSSHTLRTPR